MSDDSDFALQFDVHFVSDQVAMRTKAASDFRVRRTLVSLASR